MKIFVLADEEQQEEFLLKKNDLVNMEFVKDLSEVSADADAIFILKEIPGDFSNFQQPVFINSVVTTLKDLTSQKNIHRFNGWNTFIKREEWEIATTDEASVKTIFEKAGWKFILAKDEPGFIAARILSMIINEAYFALGENVSTKTEIDLAMKLGTNYPYGPFEWTEKIGLKNVYDLLKKLSENDPRYAVAKAMENEM